MSTPGRHRTRGNTRHGLRTAQMIQVWLWATAYSALAHYNTNGVRLVFQIFTGVFVLIAIVYTAMWNLQRKERRVQAENPSSP